MSRKVKNVWDEIKLLSSKRLFLLLMKYDGYVIEVTDQEDGSVPVCVPEFFLNEFQEILKYNQK